MPATLRTMPSISRSVDQTAKLMNVSERLHQRARQTAGAADFV